MSFNLEEFEQSPEEDSTQRLDSLVESFAETPQEDERLDEDVELRLEVASLYRLLLRGDLFSDTSNSEAATMVERRVRAFVKSELKTLLGIGGTLQQPQVAEAKPQFTEDEVTALKAVAAKITGKPAILNQPTKTQPSLKKTEVPQGTKVEPRRLVPVETKSTIAKNPPKPQKTEQTKKKPGRVVKEYVNTSGQVVEKRDVTPQTVVPGMIPQPTPQQLSAIMEQQAMASVAGMGALANLVNVAIKNNE